VATNRNWTKATTFAGAVITHEPKNPALIDVSVTGLTMNDSLLGTGLSLLFVKGVKPVAPASGVHATWMPFAGIVLPLTFWTVIGELRLLGNFDVNSGTNHFVFGAVELKALKVCNASPVKKLETTAIVPVEVTTAEPNQLFGTAAPQGGLEPGARSQVYDAPGSMLGEEKV